jgi:hypothetical protein
VGERFFPFSPPIVFPSQSSMQNPAKSFSDLKAEDFTVLEDKLVRKV